MTSGERVVELLRERGHRVTEQRMMIVDAVMRTKGHITPPDIVKRVKTKMPSVNESTVYRTLTLLEEAGVLSHAHLESGPAYHHAVAHDHAHLVCSTCGRDYYLHIDATKEMQRALRRLSGFDADFTHFAIAGRCDSCLRNESGRRAPERTRREARGGGHS